MKLVQHWHYFFRSLKDRLVSEDVERHDCAVINPLSAVRLVVARFGFGNPPAPPPPPSRSSRGADAFRFLRCEVRGDRFGCCSQEVTCRATCDESEKADRGRGPVGPFASVADGAAMLEAGLSSAEMTTFNFDPPPKRPEVSCGPFFDSLRSSCCDTERKRGRRRMSKTHCEFCSILYIAIKTRFVSRN